MSEITNVNVGSFVEKGMDKIGGMTKTLEAKMREISSGDKEMNQQDLLTLQFEMGRYQALMTALNNTVSSIQGHMKEMANSIR